MPDSHIPGFDLRTRSKAGGEGTRHPPAKPASCTEGSMKSSNGYCLKQLVFLKAKGTEFRNFLLDAILLPVSPHNAHQ